MPKQEKLYTVKELSEELKVSVQRVHQLIDKHIIGADLRLDYYIQYVPKKKYKKATLSLLLLKQKENSKFQRYHK